MIRGNTRVLSKEPIKIDLCADIHNRFDIEVIDSCTGKVKQKACAFNVVCNNVWTYLLSRPSSESTYFSCIQYGDGSGVPSATDTDLFSKKNTISVESEIVEEFDLTNRTYSFRKKITVAPDVSVGVTITEVGISKDSGNGSLCTHAMLRDMNGNQISITKTATDVINIYATMFFHWPETLESFDNSNAVLIGHRYIASHLCGLDNSTYYPRLPLLAQPQRCNAATNRTGDYIAKNATPSVNLAAKSMTYTYGRFGTENANLDNGVHYMILSTSEYGEYAGKGLFLVKPNPSIVTNESIGTGDGSTTKFSTKFDEPTNAVVKVNGTIAENVTVSPIPLRYQNMDDYFLEITQVGTQAYLINRSCGNDKLCGLTFNNPPGQTTFNGSIFFNPYYQFGIKSFYSHMKNYGGDYKVEVSNDLANWALLITSSGGRKDVPEEYRHYKYWKITGFTAGDYINELYADDIDGTNISFSEPPANGSVITIDYQTPVIAKDANHVYDLSFTMTFGEYTGT